MGSSTVSSQLCTTTFASTSGKGAIPTTTTVKTLAAEIVLILSASTPYATVTPQASTVTNTVPVTTVVTSNGVATTGTFTTTQTFTSTVVETSTVVSSSTTTFTSTTSSTSTLFIPTSQGFIPIYDSSGRSTKPNPPQKRDLPAIERKRSPLGPAGHPHEKRTGPTSAPKYPKSVTCVRYIKVRITVKLIIIKPTVTTTAAASTSTSTVAKTVTSTSTIIPPGVTSTVTQSTTSTTTSTTTTTSAVLISSTETVTQVSTTSSYAACATNNLLGPSLDNGKTVFGPYGYPDQATQQTFNENSAYDCCVRCITTPNCYVSSYAVGDKVCSNVIAGPGEECDPNQIGARIFENGNPPQSYSPTLSNGYCGKFVEGFIAS
ncbi:MAG: hypothetical protein Q9212_001956 [Teloschistes hypoglaucus]